MNVLSKSLIVTTLALGAISAHAGFAVTGTVETTHTLTGVADFTFQVTAPGGVGTITSVTTTETPGLIVGSIVGVPHSPVAIGTYSVFVNWTLASFSDLPALLGLTINGTQPLSGFSLPVSGTGTELIVPISVPEPAQTVAGAMLLGCAGVAFAGRRFLSKKEKSA